MVYKGDWKLGRGYFSVPSFSGPIFFLWSRREEAAFLFPFLVSSDLRQYLWGSKIAVPPHPFQVFYPIFLSRIVSIPACFILFLCFSLVNSVKFLPHVKVSVSILVFLFLSLSLLCFLYLLLLPLQEFSGGSSSLGSGTVWCAMWYPKQIILYKLHIIR
jgi:hypothetical protein